MVSRTCKEFCYLGLSSNAQQVSLDIEKIISLGITIFLFGPVISNCMLPTCIIIKTLPFSSLTFSMLYHWGVRVGAAMLLCVPHVTALMGCLLLV